MEQPDPKKHKYISFVKSAVRIGACMCAVNQINEPYLGILYLGFGLMFAEIIGIVEEMV